MRSSADQDREVMQALVRGDQSAVRSLIDRWERPLFSFVFRYTQNEQTTRDIVQETFVRVYTKRERYKPEFAFSSWIFTIAANLCKNHARWMKRHPEQSYDVPAAGLGENARETEKDRLIADISDPAEGASRNEDVKVLRESVEGLPHDLKTAMLLHHYEGLSYLEISEIVGCSVRGVETRLYRARKQLKSKLERLLKREETREEKKKIPVFENEPEWIRHSVPS